MKSARYRAVYRFKMAAGPQQFPLSVADTLKTFSERTVDDLAGKKSTCYATTYFSLRNAAVSKWKLSPTILFSL